MKVKPKIPQNFDEFAYTHGFNPEDFNELRILPKDYKTRIIYSEIYEAMDELEDDLYDQDVALQTRRDNRNNIKFTEKIPLTEYDKLTEEQRIAYHAFLCDYAKENDNKRQS